MLKKGQSTSSNQNICLIFARANFLFAHICFLEFSRILGGSGGWEAALGPACGRPSAGLQRHTIARASRIAKKYRCAK